jgi:hypothetical protein
MVEDPVIPPMPLRFQELRVLIHSLKLGLDSEDVDIEDKEVARRLMARIDRFAERQGAYWDKVDT